MQLRNAVLVDGVRSPFARGGRGKLVATRLDVAGAQVLRTLLENVVFVHGLDTHAGLSAAPQWSGLRRKNGDYSPTCS